MGLWVLANQTDSLGTIHLGHHEIHQNEIGVEGINYFHSLFAIFCQNEVILFEALLQDIKQVRIVVHYEDFLSHLGPSEGILLQKECHT